MARLSAKPIVNYSSVNSFSYANQWIISAANTNTLYFQLVNLDSGCGDCSLRYIPGIGTSNQPVALKVTFPSIDCTAVITMFATQPGGDGSIWSVSIPSTITPQSGAVLFQLFEGNNITSFRVEQMIAVNYNQSGSDGSLPDNTFFF